LVNPQPAISKSVSSQDTVKKTSHGFFTFRSIIYQEPWGQIALLPVRIFFQGQDRGPQYFNGKLNPFLFFLPSLAFYKLKEDPRVLEKRKKVIIAFGVLFFAFAFFSRHGGIPRSQRRGAGGPHSLTA
jgi:hypothetical protein